MLTVSIFALAATPAFSANQAYSREGTRIGKYEGIDTLFQEFPQFQRQSWNLVKTYDGIQEQPPFFKKMSNEELQAWINQVTVVWFNGEVYPDHNFDAKAFTSGYMESCHCVIRDFEKTFLDSVPVPREDSTQSDSSGPTSEDSLASEANPDTTVSTETYSTETDSQPEPEEYYPTGICACGELRGSPQCKAMHYGTRFGTSLPVRVTKPVLPQTTSTTSTTPATATNKFVDGSASNTSSKGSSSLTASLMSVTASKPAVLTGVASKPKFGVQDDATDLRTMAKKAAKRQVKVETKHFINKVGVFRKELAAVLGSQSQITECIEKVSEKIELSLRLRAYIGYAFRRDLPEQFIKELKKASKTAENVKVMRNFMKAVANRLRKLQKQ